MYDYYLGGTDNFPADREAAERILAIEPTVRDNTRANRRFLVRAVRHLAEQGITQFIDLGSGVPTSPNVHEVAHEIRPDARIVYVDNDPVVTAYDRELSEARDGVVFVEADVRRPSNIANHPAVQRSIDFTKPIAVLIVYWVAGLRNGRGQRALQKRRLIDAQQQDGRRRAQESSA